MEATSTTEPGPDFVGTVLFEGFSEALKAWAKGKAFVAGAGPAADSFPWLTSVAAAATGAGGATALAVAELGAATDAPCEGASL